MAGRSKSSGGCTRDSSKRHADILSVRSLVRLYTDAYDSYAAIATALGPPVRPRERDHYSESHRWTLCADLYNKAVAEGVFSGARLACISPDSFERAYRRAKKRYPVLCETFGNPLSAALQARLKRKLKGRSHKARMRIKEQEVKKLNAVTRKLRKRFARSGWSSR